MTSKSEKSFLELAAEETASENEAPLTTTLNVEIGVTAAAKASYEEIVGVSPFGGKVISITYTPEIEEAESSSEYRTFKVENIGTEGSGSTVLGEHSTKKPGSGTSKIAAGVEQALTLNATPANLEVGAGAILKFKDESTEGKETKGGLLQIKIARIVKEAPASAAEGASTGFIGTE